MEEKDNCLYCPLDVDIVSIKQDFSPINHSCVKIDIIIEAIESVDWSETEYTKEYLIEIMEKIRTINKKVRRWGNEQYRIVNNITTDFI